MNARTIIAYTRDADIFHPECLRGAMVRQGELAPAALDMDVSEALWQYVEANALDEGDEDYPNPVFADQANETGEYPCGICSEPILEM